MPELPEVETVRRGLVPVMEGATITRLLQRRPDLRFPLPDNFAARLETRVVLSLRRRAKYLLADIDSGETLVMHLGMSGRFEISTSRGNAVRPGSFVHDPGGHYPGSQAAHDHVVFHLSSGATVTYNDPRRFGFMLLVPTDALDQHALFQDLGPEPLGPQLTAEYLASRAKARKSDLKAFLLDQHTVAGLGNIYVSEALHRSHLSPKKSASILALRSGAPSPHAIRLVPEIKAVLNAAIQAGGSTLRDYRQTDGALGYFQHTFTVYGREGEPCQQPACTGTIKRIVQSGRSTFYCPVCQR